MSIKAAIAARKNATSNTCNTSASEIDPQVAAAFARRMEGKGNRPEVPAHIRNSPAYNEAVVALQKKYAKNEARQVTVIGLMNDFIAKDFDPDTAAAFAESQLLNLEAANAV